MLEYIKNQIDPDFVIWNGGNAPSNIDRVKPEEIVETMRKLTKLVKDQNFAKVYFTLGAHDTYPYGVYDSSEQNEIQEKYLEYFDAFLEPDELQRFRNGGFYSAPLVFRNGTKHSNSKIISFNSNFCYVFNSA